MQQQIDALQAPERLDADLGFNTDTPFIKKIMSKLLPPRFKMLQLEPHDRTANPMDHLKNFKSLMLLQGTTDATLCRVFLSTLRKATHHWYLSLESNIMDSFHQLSRMFVAHFISNRRQCRNSKFLASIKQRENEPL